MSLKALSVDQWYNAVNTAFEGKYFHFSISFIIEL